MNNQAINSKNIAVGMVFFLLGLSFVTWTSRIAEIQEKLKLNDGELGSILIAVPIGLWISLAFSGWFVKRFSSKNTAFGGLILFNLTLIMTGLCNNTLQLIIFFFLWFIL